MPARFSRGLKLRRTRFDGEIGVPMLVEKTRSWSSHLLPASRRSCACRCSWARKEGTITSGSTTVRLECLAELDEWTAGKRKRVTGELAAEEERFADRLMTQLNEFETQLGERLREQEQKLAGWWSEAERLADDRMRGAVRAVDAA